MPEKARARAAAALRRDAALEAVAFAAQRFLERPEWETIVPQVLRRLGEATSVSRVHVYENRTDGEGSLRVTLRHEWTADGIRGVIGEPAVTDAPFEQDGFARWPVILGRGDIIHGFVQDFPVTEQAELLDQGVRSLLAVPVFVDREWWGYVGFDDCATDRIWSQVEIDALRAVGGTIGAAISRRRMEEQLRDAEIDFRELVERIPAITYRQRSDGDPQHFYISPLVRDMLGYTPEEWTWTPEFWIDRVHPDDRPFVAEADEETDRSGEPCDLEYRLRRADGEYVWVRDQATRLLREDGSRYWLGFIQDVTERRRAQEALEETEERYRALVEHFPGATYLERLEGSDDPLYLSPQVEAMFGYPLAEWNGSITFWCSHIHPDDVERVREASDSSDRTGEPFWSEYRFRRSDGSYVWVHDEATRIQEEGSGFWQGFMLDVTERKEAEAALQEAEAKYRALVEQVPAAIYTQVIDEHDPGFSKTVYMSPQTEEILGYTAEEAVSDPELWRKIVHPADRAMVAAADAATNASGEPFRLEYRVLAKDGRTVWIRDEASLVRSADGHASFWQGFMLDVTERKRAEEQIERALEVEREATRRLRSLDEMKNTFLQAVSHDLRTPLAAILGLALTLERTDLALEEDEVHDLAGRIAGNARKLERLVTDLLDLDRLARGIVEPKLQPTDVGALVRAIVGDSDLVQEGRITVQAPSLVANVDAAKVERIVENLLSNTTRHTPPQTRVWVRLEHVPGGVLLTVEDDGPGVPAEHRTTVFEPFLQGPGSPDHSPGVGVGLALVSRFAQLHGGRAWVQEREGGGASFRVLLADGSRPPTTAAAAG